MPTENLRFRDESLTFKVAETSVAEDDAKKFCRYSYPGMAKTQGGFSLAVEAGEFTDSEIIVMLGENGTGKTTFIRMLAGMLPPDEGSVTPAGEALPAFNVSYKPQKISPKFDGTVRQLLHKKIQGAYLHPQFVSDVMKPMTIEPLMDQEVQHLSGELLCAGLLLVVGCWSSVCVERARAWRARERRAERARVGLCACAACRRRRSHSHAPPAPAHAPHPQHPPAPLTPPQNTPRAGGELQRVALALCLGQPADIYLIDEPSAYLDVEQRIMASKVIKRFIMHSKKTAFIVEHDFIMATYLADRCAGVCAALRCAACCVC